MRFIVLPWWGCRAWEWLVDRAMATHALIDFIVFAISVGMERLIHLKCFVFHFNLFSLQLFVHGSVLFFAEESDEEVSPPASYMAGMERRRKSVFAESYEPGDGDEASDKVCLS